MEEGKQDVSDVLRPAENEKPSDVYDLSGRRMTKPAKGLNVVRMSDGTTRKKVLRK